MSRLFSVGRILKWANLVVHQPWLILGIALSYQWLGCLPWIAQIFVVPMTIYGLWLNFILIEDQVKNPERWSVVIGGAGVSGLLMAAKLREIGITNFVILEKADELGGTWTHNKYPGIACDVPSHLYSFATWPNAWWSKMYSGGKEIWQYLDRFAEAHNLKKHIKYGKRISTVTWNETDKIVEVKTTDGEVFRGNFFVHGTGALHVPNKPEFKNSEAFKGPVFHSAEWDSSVELAGKRVGVIGTGASAVQIVPTIADKVEKLTVFQRTPAWVPERHDYKFHDAVKKMFHYAPWTATIYRYFIFWRNEALFHVAFSVNGPLVWLMRWTMTRMMRKSLQGREDLVQKLLPKYHYGCKRITPSDHYLQSYLRDNVHLETSGIDGFTSKGIRTNDGKEHEFDVIVLATGFTLLGSARAYESYGKGGSFIQDEWSDAPRAYLGITYPKLPNTFFLLGPATGLGHSTIIYMIECQVNYIADCMRKLSYEEGKVAMACKQSSLDRFIKYVDKHMVDKVFNAGCDSWYKNKRGINWTCWPLDLVTYWWKTYSCQLEDDFDLE